MNPIKALRLEKGMSQRKLAEILGVNQTSVSKWEIEKAYPDMESTHKLADYFGVSIDFIHGRETEQKTNKVDFTRGLRLMVDDAVENAKLTGLPKEFLYQFASAGLPDVYYELLQKYRRDSLFRKLVDAWGKLNHQQKKQAVAFVGRLVDTYVMEDESDE